MNKPRIKEEAEHFFEWPDPKRRDHVTLTSCLIFAEVIAGRAVDAERDACAKVCEEDGLLWGQRYAAAIRARWNK